MKKKRKKEKEKENKERTLCIFEMENIFSGVSSSNCK